MKKILGVILVIVILLLASYYGMGLITERTIKNDMVGINKSNGLSVKILKYDRSWFTSTALLQWNLLFPERVMKDAAGQTQVLPAQAYQVDMPLKIFHGPIILAKNRIKFALGYAQTDIAMPSKLDQQFASYFTKESIKPSLLMDLSVSYLNNSEVGFTILPFKLVSKDGGIFDSKGAHSQMMLSSDAEKVEGQLDINAASFTKDKMNAVMSSISTDYHFYKDKNGLYLGNASLSLASLLLNDSNNGTVELKDLLFKTDSDITDGLFKSTLDTSLKAVVAQGKTFGPATLSMGVKNLDADALAQINVLAKQAQQGTDLEKKQALLSLLRIVPKLFSKGPEFELSQLDITLPQGKIEANVYLHLPEDNTASPFALMQRIEGKGHITIPADVFEEFMLVLAQQQQAAAIANNPSTEAKPSETSQPPSTVELSAQVQKQLQTMESSGLIIKKDTMYQLDFAIEKGQLTINSKPFVSDMLKF